MDTLEVFETGVTSAKSSKRTFSGNGSTKRMETLLTPKIGETIFINKEGVTETTRWWREYY